MSVVSLGYERRSLPELVEILGQYRVEKLLDIREIPFSMRRDFSQGPLAEALRGQGIQYRHLRAAGNPYHREKTDVARCLARYSEYLDAHPEVLESVAAEIAGSRVAVFCYERRHSHCHRSVLLAALNAGGYEIDVINVE